MPGFPGWNKVMNNFDLLWRSVQEVDNELKQLLARTEPTFADIDNLIARYRSICQKTSLADFETASSKNIEGRLWDAHLKINTRYRKLLSKFADDGGKQRPVEKRKLEKRYLTFVKSSTRFYREYIYQLSTAFGSLPELLDIVKSLHFDVLPTTSSNQPTENLRRAITRSCHSSLVRLGDLSRYRETELKKKDRKWGPAIGYYDLATALNPDSGASHNQLAAIAIADKNHIRIVYHLHRALTVEEPFPTAKANLDSEFKKILETWRNKELADAEDQGEPGKALSVWFVYLHARCYKGVELGEHDELENEFLRHLTVELKERPLDNLLQKVCLINIAAEYLAGGRAQETPEAGEHLQSFISLLRLNVKTFFTLLQILLPELEPYKSDNIPEESQKIPERLTATARRILPALRQYSSWLQTNSHLLVAMQSNAFVSVHLNEFWKIYADALTLLIATFPVLDLPSVDYLLDEDEDTIAFKPLCNENTHLRYFDPEVMKMKSRRGGGIERSHPNDEMLSRIRGLVTDAVQLCRDEDQQGGVSVPIKLRNECFVYCEDEEALVPELPLTPGMRNSHRHTDSATSINRDDIELAKKSSPAVHPLVHGEDGTSQYGTASVSTDMHNMVDKLVSSETSEPEQDSIDDVNRNRLSLQNATPDGLNGTPRASHAFLNSQPRAPSMEREETIRPVLPSIWNTPFAPLPGEANSSPRTRPSTAHYLDSNTSGGVSSSGLFRQDLARQQDLLALQSSPIQSIEAPSSWTEQPMFNGQADAVSATATPFQGSGLLSSSEYGSSAVDDFGPEILNRQRKEIGARFGVIGETPPSGQQG